MDSNNKSDASAWSAMIFLLLLLESTLLFITTCASLVLHCHDDCCTTIRLLACDDDDDYMILLPRSGDFSRDETNILLLLLLQLSNDQARTTLLSFNPFFNSWLTGWFQLLDGLCAGMSVCVCVYVSLFSSVERRRRRWRRRCCWQDSLSLNVPNARQVKWAFLLLTYASPGLL